MENPREVIRKFVEEELDPSGDEKGIPEEANILTSGMVDSLGVLKLVSFIEHQFGTEIPDEDLTVANFRSLKAIGDYLEQRKHNRS